MEELASVSFSSFSLALLLPLAVAPLPQTMLISLPVPLLSFDLFELEDPRY